MLEGSEAMLIEFEVGNYLSFAEPVALSMLAAKALKDSPDNYRQDPIVGGVLTSAAIYGANASGKSNFFKAVRFARSMILGSSKDTQADEPIPVEPFKLAEEYQVKPGHFQFVFSLGSEVYRYGFDTDSSQIHKEWLFLVRKRSEVNLFLREFQDITITKAFSEGNGLESRTRRNALFLSVAAQFNGEIAGKIVEWARRLTILERGADPGGVQRTSILRDTELRDEMLRLLRTADLGISDLKVEEQAISDVFVNAKMTDAQREDLVAFFGPNLISVKAMHTKYRDGQPDGLVEMDFDSEESLGTQLFLTLGGFILRGLRDGATLFADELDTSLHPLLVLALVRLFHSHETNKLGAQLIFSTHDTNVLSYGGLRRDQIWFTEKKRCQDTDLYSLAEVKQTTGKVRKDASYEKDYLKGRYGAIPYLGDLQNLWEGAAIGKTDKTK